MADADHCGHLKTTEARKAAVKPSGEGCVECLRSHSIWVHLRLCMTCGHVGCCDNSPNRHATKHAHATGHPIIRSIQPGEHWYWCYVDELAFELQS